ncbi:hypothetical protein MLD38_005815 [Melastoma candidum]|uniref:Uncharacterized protein n=1 Tax=Melastoma candidum TaxID=119954 RepID=A0ACB9RPL5_9MYRT|nr:hypothetical protein MLD38_005815 [Melastoma candidum]
MGVSNNVTAVLNLITLLCSVPIISSGVRLSSKPNNECTHHLRWPTVILGTLLLLGLAGPGLLHMEQPPGPAMLQLQLLQGWTSGEPPGGMEEKTNRIVTAVAIILICAYIIACSAFRNAMIAARIGLMLGLKATLDGYLSLMLTI